MKHYKNEVRIVLREDKAKRNNCYPLYFLIRFNGLKVKIPTGKSIETHNWDKKTSKPTKEYKNADALMHALEKKIIEYKTYILSCENLSKPVDKETIKHFFKGVDQQSFYEFYRKQYDNWKITKKLKPSTQKVYDTTLTILKKYKKELLFSEKMSNLHHSFK